MTIYLDILFVTNLWINYFLLLITAQLVQSVCKTWKILLSSVVGSLYCVLFFSFSSPPFLSVVCKLLSGVLMAFLAFGYKSFKRFLRCTVTFFIVSFLFGGILYGIYFLFRPRVLFIRNSIPYIRVSPILMILCSAAVYVFLVGFQRLTRPPILSPKTAYEVQITYRKKSVVSTGFLDTGNALRDVFTDTPVVLCAYPVIRDLLSEQEQVVFADFSARTDPMGLPEKIRLVSVHTVGGSSLLPAFIPEELELRVHEKHFSTDRVLIAVYNPQSYHTDHSVILNPQLILSEKRGGISHVS